MLTTTPDTPKIEIERHPVELMPKQAEFVGSNSMWILYSGAVRAGKSRALCYRAMRIASESPKAKFGLCRKTLVSLKQTTLRTLLEPDGDLPPVLPPDSYKHSTAPGKERIILNNGGEIIYFGCDNPEKIGSLTLSAVGVDEGIELDEAEWNMLATRCSLAFTMPDGSQNRRTLATATNPGSPNHFLYRIFFQEKRPRSERHLIITSSLDNWHLPKDYVEKSLAHLPEQAKLRYLHGVWAAFEGAIYPMYERSLHDYHDPGPWEYYVGGLDYGFSHRTALRIHGVRTSGTGRPISHVVSEFYQPNATRGDVVDLGHQASRLFSPLHFVVDPSAPDIVEELKRAGHYAKPGINDVKAGIRCVAAALTEILDGHPRLTFEPGLAGNIEYMTYSWKPDSVNEDPIKKQDDAVDADRYAMMDIDGTGEVRRLCPLNGPTLASMKQAEVLRAANVRHIPPPPDPMDPRWWG